MVDTLVFDVVIVGAGLAGLVAALDLLDHAPELTVAVLDKGEIGSGSSPLAQGGMAAAIGPDDSPELHARDTIRASDGLCDRRAVAVMTSAGPARVADLVARGAVFDRDAAGALDLAREDGQSVARSVRAADATGAAIMRALRTAATGRVTRVQGSAIELALDASPQRGVCGVWALLDPGGVALLAAPAVVLATGGCGGLYAATTNRDGATADGVALAARAGAQLVDLEFVQFHPTGLRVDDGAAFWRLLLTEALRGAGASWSTATVAASCSSAIPTRSSRPATS
jgi:L-aspartate oxidase